jgi:rhodanese-related sulfurtransferase
MIQQITVQQLKTRLEKGESTYLLDIRQQWEHDTAALPGSVLIPLDQLSLRAEEIQPAEEALVVVYCHHGIRSLSGAAMLQHLGFRNVVSLAGGIDTWSLHVDPKLPRY